MSIEQNPLAIKSGDTFPKMSEIGEIEKEVNNDQFYVNPFKAKEYLKILLSHIHILEQEIQDIRNDPDHWDRKYEKFLLDKISTFEKRVKEWDYISHLNATMKQLDTNYLSAIQLAETYKKGWEQAETERERLSKELIEERMKIVELCDAVEKHEQFKRTHEKVVALEDEELYKVMMKEMKDGGDALMTAGYPGHPANCDCLQCKPM